MSAGFFQEADGSWSMTRLCALCCIVAGCALALWKPEHWQTVTALVGGGGVALLTRSKD